MQFAQGLQASELFAGRFLECLVNEFRAIDRRIVEIVVNVVGKPFVAFSGLNERADLRAIGLFQAIDAVLPVAGLGDPIRKRRLAHRADCFDHRPSRGRLVKNPAMRVRRTRRTLDGVDERIARERLENNVAFLASEGS